MNRGDHYEEIYRDDQDRKIFLDILSETCESSGWRVHSFVLMRNHYHLLIETVRATLVKGMQYLNGTYTQRYNIRHKLRGHLFQGRYKSLLVDAEAKGYFLTVSDYIHLNPLRAKKLRSVPELLEDPWSSAGWFAGTRKGKPDWLDWELVYGELGLRRWNKRARREFQKYLETRFFTEAVNRESTKQIQRGWCFGSESFVNRMKGMLEEMREDRPRGPECWSGKLVEEAEEDRAKKLLCEAMRKLGYESFDEVQGLDRYLIGKFVRQKSKVRIQWLADQLRVETRAGMSHMLYWTTKKMQTDTRLRKRWNSLL